MTKHEISIEKTARYFTMGEMNDSVTRVWYVLHGYAQLAEHFIYKFSVLNNGNNLVVAPEGLHRFYSSGNSGKVGASWMTKEEREADIRDYVRYLDQLHSEIQNKYPRAAITILGFSQGAATAARWVAYGHVQPEKVIFWGGLFPPDMGWDTTSTKWKSTRLHVLIGNEDEYYKSEEFKEYYQPVISRFNNATFTIYNGKHTIYENVLKELM